MLTYSFENRGKESLYEYLYRQIKNDILGGKLAADEKLPSVRAFAGHLDVSTITVENTYQQLAAEGYIYSKPKSGFYVADVSNMVPVKSRYGEDTAARTGVRSGKHTVEQRFADFGSNSIAPDNFPFTIWTKMLRETMADDADKLMVKSPSTGVFALRKAIADYLYQFCGMDVEPEQIVIGAGTEYLYGLIIQLLGRDKVYGVEDPGYQKIVQIYAANQVKCVPISMDGKGVRIRQLEEKGVNVLHISPSHHFPTGIVMPIRRRSDLLAWAEKEPGRFIIEDDYDSEFRLIGKPIPSMQSIDANGKVIYMNTFSKSLTSTIRISYMVLPKGLMEQYIKELSFYSCTVSNFEQYTLARFIEKGHFEKHINRMRNYYRSEKDALITAIKKHPYANRIKIREEHAGLHFLLQVTTGLTDEEMVKKAAENGVNISCLSEYYSEKEKASQHTLVINYSGIEKAKIADAVERLFQSLW